MLLAWRLLIASALLTAAQRPDRRVGRASERVSASAASLNGHCERASGQRASGQLLRLGAAVRISIFSTPVTDEQVSVR